LAQEVSWHLCIYDKRNNKKVIAKYLFYNIPFPKFYLNQISITIKKKEKNLILEKASNFQNFLLMFS